MATAPQTPTLTQQEQEQDQDQEHSQPSSFPPHFPFPASLSLSLSTFSPSNLLISSKPPPSPPPSSLSLSSTKPFHLSLFSSSTHPFLNPSSLTNPKKTPTKSTISSSPLHSSLLFPNLSSPSPSSAAALRRASIVWFRTDLRLHDNEALTSANNESLSVLPVYCFDPRDYGKSSSGFDKTGPYRATFLIESVSDLRRSLKARGSDLVVRIGKPEVVLVELARTVGADAVYAHREVSHDEVEAEEKSEGALKEEGVESKFLWGSTLYHIDDLPFKLEEMPSSYGGFREKVKGLGVRETIQALDQLKGLPGRGDVEPGEIPSLLDLGLNPSSTLAQDGKPAANASLVGGETEALQRLKKFATECRAQPSKGNKDNSGGNIYGANFSCKISPWLAMGCLSPRFMFDELKKSAKRTISASVDKKPRGGSADDGMNWLMFELLWRDFFRFITKKYSSNKRKFSAVPATACTGALV